MQSGLNLRWVRNGAPLVLGLVLLLATALISAAQSGRRPPKPPKSPDPIPSKQDEPPIAQPSEEKSVPKIPVKVAWQLDAISSSAIYSRSVQEACLVELSRSGSIAASATGELNRKKAVDMAKASSDTYVVWFQLEPDPAYSDRFGIGAVPPQYLTIRFDVFEPSTGKPKTSGHVYQRSVGPGGLPLPGPGTNNSSRYGLEYAGAEMADRILAALGVSRPR
jgi:hypothetical protein